MNRPVPGHDLPSDRAVLRSFDRALSRETGTLSGRPEILWQQLYNDLKWADPPLDSVLGAELARRLATPARAWILRHSHPSQAEALQLVLDAGVTPESCTVGARGDFVAAAADGTLRRWDSRSGRLLNEFDLGPRAQLGYRGCVCGATADGALVCLEDNLNTFRIRDPASGELRAQLPHETLTIGAAAVTSEGNVLLEIDGHSLRAWMDEGEAWTVHDQAGDIAACALDEWVTDSGSKGIVVSTTVDGVVTVREVSWFDYDSMEPFISTTTRWQLPDRGSTPAPVVACAVSEAAGLVVLADAQGILRICDARTGAVRELIGTPGTAVTCCAVSPDGTTVFAGAGDGTITVWDVPGRAVRRAFEAHAGPVTSCAVGRDGMLFCSGGEDGLVRRWDLQNGIEMFSFRPVTGDIRTCAVSHNLDALVAVTETGALEHWWHKSRELAYASGGPYKSVAWDVAEGGRFLVAAFADGTLHLWDTDTVRERRVPGVPDGKATSCSVSPNGALLAVGMEDGTLRIIDARTGNVEWTLEASEKSVACCHIGSDGDLVVSGGADGSFRGWSAATGEQRFSVTAHTSGVRSCAISADGRFAVSCPDQWGSLSEPARVWDTRTGAKLADLEAGASHYIPDCAVSPDAEFIVTAGAADNAVRIWDAQPSRPERAGAVIHGGPVCTFTPDGESIVTGWGRTLAVVNASNGEQRFTLDHGGPAWACAVSPDGDFIVTGGDEAIIRIWDAHTGEQRREFRPSVGPQTGPLREEVPRAVAVSPGADLVASEEFIGRVRLWDLKRGDEWVIEGGHATFTPDGASLYGKTEEGTPILLDIGTGSTHPIPDVSSRRWSSSDARFTFANEGDGVLSVRDVHTGVEHGTIRAHPTELKVGATSPDGQFEVTGGDDAMLKVWDLRTADLAAVIPLPAVPMRLSLHPYAPFIACTDFSGNLNRMELVGIEYGPIPVTAVQEDDGPMLRCPKCFRTSRLREEWRDQIIGCPTPGCDLPMYVDADIAHLFSGTPATELRVEPPPAPTGVSEAAVEAILRDLLSDPAEPGPLEHTPRPSARSEPPSTPQDLSSRISAWSGAPEETPRRGWFRRRRRK